MEKIGEGMSRSEQKRIRAQTRATVEQELDQARDALDFGDGTVGTDVKRTAYTRAIAKALVVLAQCALDSRAEGKT